MIYSLLAQVQIGDVYERLAALQQETNSLRAWIQWKLAVEIFVLAVVLWFVARARAHVSRADKILSWVELHGQMTDRRVAKVSEVVSNEARDIKQTVAKVPDATVEKLKESHIPSQGTSR